MRYFGDLAHDAANRRWLLSGIAPHVALRLKSMFPRIDKTLTGRFGFSDTDEGCQDLDWFMHRCPMRMNDQDAGRLAAGVHSQAARQAEALAIMAEGWVPATTAPGFKPDRAPYPNQERNAALAAASRAGWISRRSACSRS